MKAIPGWIGYFADILGNIYSMRPYPWNAKPPTVPRRLKQTIGNHGYYIVTLCDGTRKQPRTVHNIILETFVGPCPEGLEGCHNDGKKLNNALSNLRWDTPDNNAADKVKHGTLTNGERCWNHKLTEMQVLDIRRRYGLGETRSELAAVFGICHRTVGKIVHRKSWSHVSNISPVLFQSP